MTKKYFTVGPSAIYPSCSIHTIEYFDKGYGSESHRSKVFQSIYKNLDEQLRELMDIPNTHSIFIASSGSEIFERILQNCVQKTSFHFVNGAFSKKFHQYAQRFQLNALKHEVADGTGFDEIPVIQDEVELICITHNETSTGIKTDAEYIHKIKELYPNKMIAVDTVSSAPFFRFDFSKVDMTFFSSQKAFGLPAGVGIWIINTDLVQKLIESNYSLGKGAHNILADYSKNYQSFQTPSTPNTLGVYLMSKVAEDMNQIGWNKLNEEALAKKEYMSSILSQNEWVKRIHPLHSSDTIFITELLKDKLEFKHHIEKNHIITSSGYGIYADTQIRFSNFPANTMEDLEYLNVILSKN